MLINNVSHSQPPIFILFLLLFVNHYYSYNIVRSFELNTMQLFYKLNFFYIKLFGKKINRIKVLFDHHFFVNKYYLHKSASGEALSNMLNITNIELEQIVTKNYSIGFDSLRDMYRFKHFWEEFTNPLNADLPIQSVIAFCGFSSNQEFNSLIADHKEVSKHILKKNFS
jgi:hypothetical protein